MDEKEKRILIFSIVIFAILAIPRLFAPLFIDSWIFVYIGKNMSFDKLPYRDLDDNKGIMTYLYYRGLDFFFGQNYLAWRICGMLMVILSALVFWRILRNRIGKEQALAGTAFFLAIELFPATVSFELSETIGLLPMLCAIALLYENRKWGEKADIAAGLLFSLSLLTNIIFIPAIFVFALLHLFGEVRIRRHFVIAAAILPVLFIAILLATGSLGAFIERFVYYNLSFSRAVIGEGGYLLPLAFILNYSIIMLIAAALAILFFKRFRKQRNFIVALMPLVLVSGTQIFLYASPNHYHVPVIPLYASCFAIIFGGFSGFDGKAVRGLLIAFLALTALYATNASIAELGHFPQDDDVIFAKAAKAEFPMFFNSGRLLAPSYDMRPSRLYYLANSSYPGHYFFMFSTFARIPWFQQKIDRDIIGNINSGNIDYIVASADCPTLSCPTRAISNAIAKNFRCTKARDFGLGKEYNYTYCISNRLNSSDDRFRGVDYG